MLTALSCPARWLRHAPALGDGLPQGGTIQSAVPSYGEFEKERPGKRPWRFLRRFDLHRLRCLPADRPACIWRGRTNVLRKGPTRGNARSAAGVPCAAVLSDWLYWLPGGRRREGRDAGLPAAH